VAAEVLQAQAAEAAVLAVVQAAEAEVEAAATSQASVLIGGTIYIGGQPSPIMHQTQGQAADQEDHHQALSHLLITAPYPL